MNSSIECWLSSPIGLTTDGKTLLSFFPTLLETKDKEAFFKTQVEIFGQDQLFFTGGHKLLCTKNGESLCINLNRVYWRYNIFTKVETFNVNSTDKEFHFFVKDKIIHKILIKSFYNDSSDVIKLDKKISVILLGISTCGDRVTSKTCFTFDEPLDTFSNANSVIKLIESNFSTRAKIVHSLFYHYQNIVEQQYRIISVDHHYTNTNTGISGIEKFQLSKNSHGLSKESKKNFLITKAKHIAGYSCFYDYSRWSGAFEFSKFQLFDRNDELFLSKIHLDNGTTIGTKDYMSGLEKMLLIRVFEVGVVNIIVNLLF